jgi:hypothetical protein
LFVVVSAVVVLWHNLLLELRQTCYLVNSRVRYVPFTWLIVAVKSNKLKSAKQLETRQSQVISAPSEWELPYGVAICSSFGMFDGIPRVIVAD